MRSHGSWSTTVKSPYPTVATVAVLKLSASSVDIPGSRSPTLHDGRHRDQGDQGEQCPDAANCTGVPNTGA